MAFEKLADEIWRDFVTPLVPSAPPWEPRKGEIRKWGSEVEKRLTRKIHADDYGGDLSLAVADLPLEGGVIELGRGAYTSPWNTIANRMTRKSIRIVGQGVPDFNHRTAPTALVGGTIIRGPIIFDADNLRIEGLGFDVGADYCAANHGGTPQEGVWLGLPTASGGVRRYGLYMQDFAILGHQTNSNIHDLIAINYDDGYVRHAKTRLGGDGLVFFVRNMDTGGFDCGGHSKYSVLYKATSDGDLRGVVVDNVIMRSLGVPDPNWLIPGQFDTQGLFIEAAEADARGMVINNIYAYGCINGLVLDGAQNFAVRDTTASNVHIERSAFQPILVRDNAARNKIMNFTSQKSGDGILIGSGCIDTTLGFGRINEANAYPISNSGTNTLVVACEQSGNAVGGATSGLRNVTGTSRVEASLSFSTPVILAGSSVVGGKSPGITDNATAPILSLDSADRAQISGAAINNGKFTVHKAAGQDGVNVSVAGTAVENMHRFFNANGAVGSISVNGSTTSFNTTSDPRLKKNVAKLKGSDAVDILMKLNPSTYNFIADGEEGVGFLSTELEQIFPLAVTGDRDAVDADGVIIPQQVDQSKLIPLLVAAVQELAAKGKK